jgi:hypothetical protein
MNTTKNLQELVLAGRNVFAREALRNKGWSYRSASKEIGRSYQWVFNVLNGRATSRPVLEEIFKLPDRNKSRGAR